MPNIEQLHNDVALANVSLGYQNSEFIGQTLAPFVPVDKQSNKYWIFDFENFTPDNDRRRPGAKFNRVDWDLSSDTYYAEGHGLEGKVPVEYTANEDPGLDVLADTTETVTEKIMLNHEINVANTLTNAATYASSNKTALAGDGTAKTNLWTGQGGDPLAVAADARAAVKLATGKLPNVLALGFEVFEALKIHPDILERIKYSQTGIVTAELLAQIFEVDRVLVGESMKNTAKRGQTASLGYIWGDHALFAYAPTTPRQKEVSLMYTFRWRTAPNSTEGASVVRYWDQSEKSWIVQVDQYYDTKVVAAGAGYLVDNAV